MKIAKRRRLQTFVTDIGTGPVPTATRAPLWKRKRLNAAEIATEAKAAYVVFRDLPLEHYAEPPPMWIATETVATLPRRRMA